MPEFSGMESVSESILCGLMKNIETGGGDAPVNSYLYLFRTIKTSFLLPYAPKKKAFSAKFLT